MPAKKYKTSKELKNAIEKYFKSISRTVEARDLSGEVILNDDGEPIRYLQYITPPSACALCLFLGIDKKTWSNYCDEEKHPEFHEVTEHTRLRIKTYLVEQLNTRQKGSLQGIMFNLSNNYGWKDKRELELGEKTRKSIPAAGMSVYDKIAAIATAQAAIGSVPEYCGEDAGEER